MFIKTFAEVLIDEALGASWVLGGSSDYTVDHNTNINTATPNSTLAFAESHRGEISNFVFTNNLATPTRYGFFGPGVGERTRALNGNFTNWRFSRNVIVDGPAGSYPAGNFFPAGVAAVRFVNYAGGNYTLAADSPYKNAGTDGTDIGVNGAQATNVKVVLPTDQRGREMMPAPRGTQGAKPPSMASNSPTRL
jgi:hypothetical protein